MKRFVAALGTLALVAVLVPAVGKQPGVAAAPILAGRVHKEFVPSQGKLFVLVIGNDARHGNPDRSRADAIHIVGLDTKTMRGGILNFPRDTWVAIPGHGSGKINEALYSGGPDLLARTLENLTGIRLDYWVMTGFQGFVEIVRDLGRVTLRLRQPIFDSASGARLRAGKNLLGGHGSLAFVRSRKTLPRGDIDRSTNQARFLLALLRKLRANVRRNPAHLLRWISVGRRNTRLNMSPEEQFRLAVLATQVRPSRVRTVTIPVSIGSVGSASVVFMAPGARPIFARFRRTARL
jgi:LCP family protein required for cell wall assembly